MKTISQVKFLIFHSLRKVQKVRADHFQKTVGAEALG